MASGTPVLPGGNNTYVRTHEASGKLVVGFSRNVKDFALNKYIQLKDVPKTSGFYLRITTEEAGRILDSDLQDFAWPDGADRPQNNDGTELFAYHDFRTERYDFNYKIGRLAAEQADWGISESHQQIKAQQAMTARTAAVHAALNTAGNWESDHTIDVTTIPGNTGAWDVDTTTRGDLQRSLNYASEIIMKSTLSVVKKKDLVLVLNPNTAHAIAETQMLKDQLKQSPYALNQVEIGNTQFDQYGLPDKLFGYNVVVEDSVKVTSRRGASSATREFVMPDATAYLLARPGGLVAPPGAGPSFSTCTLFLKEDMSVEEFDDPKHRRIEGHVVDDHDPVVTASASGFRFTAVTS